ncbi:stage II sporulation protein M [Halobaculum sp. D14]|uniref:stage II sporulation protein M n=1 Tax=Halobaculum sp. D14 TaxID=3421642 RepID=UPI003EBA77FB
MSDSPPSVGGALTAAGRVLLDRPAAVLPAYLLALGVLPAARVPLLTAAGVAVALLARAGRIEPVAEAYVDAQRAADDESIVSGGTLPPELTEAAAGLATPTVGALLVAGLLGAVVVALLGRGVAAAITHETVLAALNGRDDPLAAGVAGAARWRTFLGLTLLRGALPVAGLGVAVVAAVGLAATGTAVGVVAGVLVALLGVLFAVAVAFLLAFAPAAVVVDDVGVGGAVRGSVGFIRRRPVRAVAYALIAAGAVVAAGVAAAALNVAAAGRVVGVAVPLLLTPVLDAFVVALYGDASLPAADRSSARSRVASAVADGCRALAGFVRGHVAATVAAAAVLVAGLAAGYGLTAPYDVRLPVPDDVAGTFGAVPVGPFVTIAANNWLVGVSGAFGGLAFGVPAVTGLVFNGALIGALAGIYDRTAFLALVAPHGVVELPALAVSAAVGLHLGAVGWRAVRGRTTAAAVADELRRATRVFVGLAVVFVAAAFVEAFVTPRVAALVLG